MTDATHSSSAEGSGKASATPLPGAARLAQAAVVRLCRAEAFSREPILREDVRAERDAAVASLRAALDLLENAA